MNFLTLLAAIAKDQVKIPQAEINQAQFSNALGLVFGLAAVVAVIFIILGGIRYAISQGNASDLQKGKDMIVYALVGLGIVLTAFTITQFVTANLF